MSVGDWYKAITCQKPTPERQQELVKQRLDELEGALRKRTTERDAALAKLAAMGSVEPVAWRYEIEDGVYRYCRHKADTDMQAEFGVLNPVALYAAPKVAPLTSQRIHELFKQHLRVSQLDGYSIHGSEEFTRAIEAAHGIGGQQP